MRRSHLRHLVCPRCKQDLGLTSDAGVSDPVETGALVCRGCATSYPITKFIPRFVPNDNYAAGFGFQWNRHYETQYDRYSGARVSEERFFKETRWGHALGGQLLLEAGC